MTKTISRIVALSIILLATFSCLDNDDFVRNSSDFENDIETEFEAESFVWKALNEYYFWQEDVPNLADDKFTSQSELDDFITGFDGPEDLFYNGLLNNYPETDRFSWITDDYQTLNNLLRQGVTGTNGLEFGLIKENESSNLFGFIKYIIPDSDAASKDVQRGEIFNMVDGTQLTTENFQSLLFSSNSYTLSFADLNGGIAVSNGKTVDLTKSEIPENPVFISKIIEQSGKKIGYLMYNSFTPSFDNELNQAFADLKASGITNFILDLRYNSGGSVRTATYLASMITGQFNEELFVKEQWNSKIQSFFEANEPDRINNYFTNEFVDGTTINSINQSEIVIITSETTASASELIINGLNPYINITTIGDVTVGKVEGSISLYDSEDFSDENINPNHTYAIQPIVLQTTNVDGENHPNGISPDILLIEQFDNLGILGELSDPLLQTAVNTITGETVSRQELFNQEDYKEFSNSNFNKATTNKMYVDSF